MPNDHVTLLAVGDIGPEIEPAEQFAEKISRVLDQADLRFGNCERVYSERAGALEVAYSHGHPHPRLASIFAATKMDVLSVANNHIMNLGPEAMLDTVEVLRKMGKITVGAGKNIGEARKPAVIDRNGVKIAFLAYTSVLEAGQEAKHNRPGMAPMRVRSFFSQAAKPGEPPQVMTFPVEDDLAALCDDIKSAKRQADVVVMSIHWGVCHIPKAMADYQSVVAHAAIDAGADLILGHHQHCLRAVEVYKGKVCFHGLGNFIITHKLKHFRSPAQWNSWNLWWYRLESEYLPPKGLYDYPPDCRITMLAKAVFSKKGVEKISFLPALINAQAQPAVVPPSDPKFQEILGYVEWVSDQFPHQFQADGNEILVKTSA